MKVGQGHEAMHAVDHDPLHARARLEAMEVRQRLAEGEDDLVVVEMAREQDRHHVPARWRPSGPMRGNRDFHVVQARIVMGDELIEARVQPDEGEAVARQDQRVGRQAAEAREAVEEPGQRIGQRLVGPHADIGADLGQHLVARDHHVELGAPQRGMLGRVAAADDDVPAMAADGDGMRMDHAPESGRQRHHALGVAALVAMEVGDAVGRHAVARDMRGARLLALDEVVARGLRAHVLAQRHVERGVPLLAQPAGEADMVGMEMRADHAHHRFALELLGEDLLPERSRVLRIDAGVDDRPAVLLLDQPQVDVVELEGQRHAQPVDAGGDILDVAGLGHVTTGKAKLRQQALGLGEGVRHVLP